jgi:hypothetical protein
MSEKRYRVYVTLSMLQECAEALFEQRDPTGEPAGRTEERITTWIRQIEEREREGGERAGT